MSRVEQDFEIAIIGGGIAGMMCAARAAQLGGKVVVLEKGSAEKYLCNSRYTGGTFHCSFKDIELPPEELKRIVATETAGFARQDLVDAIGDDALRCVKWLASEGIRFIRLGGAHKWVLAPPSRTGPGLNWEGRGGDVTLQKLESNLRQRGGRLDRGARAVGLRRDAQRGLWTVEADVGGQHVMYEARRVVIADGGFQANIEMLGANIAPAPKGVLQRGAATGQGDGLMIARGVGARITELTCFYGHLLSRDAPNNVRLWPRPYFDVLVECGIVVDDQGSRLADEGLGGIYMANMVARLPNPRSANVVFDHDGWTGPGANALIPTNPHLVNEGGTLHKAESIADLARVMGASAETLGNTIDTYNQALKDGRLAQLSPARSTHKFKPLPIAKAPFYAIPMCTGVTYTMGGIAIDGRSRVLDHQDQPIPDLFAVGCCTGGLEGGPVVGYVGGLTKSAVTSVRAAEFIRGAMAA